MKEKKLTIDQERRIEEIKAQWFKDLDELEEIDLGGNSLSNYSNHGRRELEKKYAPQIRAIYNK